MPGFDISIWLHILEQLPALLRLFIPAGLDRASAFVILCYPFVVLFCRIFCYTVTIQSEFERRDIFMRRVISGLLVLLMLIPLASCGREYRTSCRFRCDGGARGTQGTGAPMRFWTQSCMPEGGVRDGITYAAYDGVVEHCFSTQWWPIRSCL